MADAFLLHFADTYYRPSWQGGDIERPLCHRGRRGICVATLTGEPDRVTCHLCRVKLGLAPLTPVQRKAAVVSLPSDSPLLHNVKTTRTAIAYEIAQAHGVTVADLKSRSRIRLHSRPRQEAMTAMMAAGFSSTAAGAYFGRDHTTALAAKKAVLERSTKVRGNFGDKSSHRASSTVSSGAKQANIAA